MQSLYLTLNNLFIRKKERKEKKRKKKFLEPVVPSKRDNNKIINREFVLGRYGKSR